MEDNLQKYLPEFDDEETRAKLSGFSREELLDLLVRAYKEKRLFAKLADEYWKKLSRIEAILSEPSALSTMPGVPNANDLRRMMDDEK